MRLSLSYCISLLEEAELMSSIVLSLGGTTVSAIFMLDSSMISYFHFSHMLIHCDRECLFYALMIFCFLAFLPIDGPAAPAGPPIPAIISFNRSSLTPPPVTAALCNGNISLTFQPRGTAGGGGGLSGIGMPRIGSSMGESSVVGLFFRNAEMWRYRWRSVESC